MTTKWWLQVIGHRLKTLYPFLGHADTLGEVLRALFVQWFKMSDHVYWSLSADCKKQGQKLLSSAVYFLHVPCSSLSEKPVTDQEILSETSKARVMMNI